MFSGSNYGDAPLHPKLAQWARRLFLIFSYVQYWWQEWQTTKEIHQKGIGWRRVPVRARIELIVLLS